MITCKKTVGTIPLYKPAKPSYKYIRYIDLVIDVYALPKFFGVWIYAPFEVLNFKSFWKHENKKKEKKTTFMVIFGQKLPLTFAEPKCKMQFFSNKVSFYLSEATF